MGLEINNNAIFLSIGDGKITRRVKQPTEKSVQRTTKEGKIVNEEIYDAVSGLLMDIKIYEHEQWGKFWNIYLKDGEDTYCLQMNYSGGYASAFLKILPNADLSKRVKLIPSMKMEGDKKKVSLFITQEGEPLKHFWTKDNPRDLPQMNQVKVKGKLTWDDSEMMEYLEKMVNEKILPKLKKAAVSVPPDNVPEPIAEDKDDLPF